MFSVPTSSRADLASLFQGLADPTRLRLLNLLSNGEVCVCHLTDCLGMVQPKISRHLAHLRRAGLVTARREGKWMYYRRTQHAHPAAGKVVNGLRTWMNQDPALSRESAKLQRLRSRTTKGNSK